MFKCGVRTIIPAGHSTVTAAPPETTPAQLQLPVDIAERSCLVLFANHAYFRYVDKIVVHKDRAPANSELRSKESLYDDQDDVLSQRLRRGLGRREEKPRQNGSRA